jgi:hypothetical protein
MYSVFSLENMATKADRCKANDIRLNGCVSVSVFKKEIFILAKQD